MLVERNTAAAQKRKGGGRGSLIHCKNGHPFLGDNLIWKPRSDGGQGLWHCCKTCKRETTERGALMKPSELRRVREAVKAGFKIIDITRDTPERKAIVTNSKLRRYRAEHPEFDRFLIENSQDLRSRARLLECKIVPAQLVIAAPTIIKPARREVAPYLYQDGDLEWISSLIPRGFPQRDDVIQNMFVDLVTRAISRDEVTVRIRRLKPSRSAYFPRGIGSLGIASSYHSTRYCSRMARRPVGIG